MRIKNSTALSRLILLSVTTLLMTNLCANAHDLQDGDSANVPPPLPSQDYEPSLGNKLEAVIDQYKVWETGTTLRACFMSDDAAGVDVDRRKFFVDAANVWTDAAPGIDINFGEPPTFRECDPNLPSHLRVSFEPGKGNWSYVGTDSLRSGFSKASLNIGFQADTSMTLVSQNRLRGKIVHELGHALGMLHEHQSPRADCEAEMLWDTVYIELGGPPNNWDAEKVDRNLRQLVRSPRLRLSAYDTDSVMHYYLQPSWLTAGRESKCFVIRKNIPSDADKKAIAEAYPETLEEQADYLAKLDAASAQVVIGLGASDEQIDLIESDINAAIDGIFDEAGFSKTEFANAVTNTSTEVTTTITTTNGDCSPAISGVGGDVKLECSIDSSATVHGSGIANTGNQEIGGDVDINR